MDDQDHPPLLTLDQIEASLEESLADLKAGRTVPIEDVLADLDACIERMEARRAAKVTHAA
jgi:predicted transcriptional regulator